MRKIVRRLPLLAGATLWLTACTVATFEPGVCPAPVPYTPAQQAQAAADLMALPDGSTLALMIEDYGRERARLRACR